jgi:hypothetical protein
VSSGHHGVALRKGVGRPTGIDQLRMEHTSLKGVAKDDRMRNCCLPADSAIRFVQPSEVARIRDLRDEAGFALRSPLTCRHGISVRLTLRRGPFHSLRRSTKVARLMGHAPNSPRLGQQVMPGPADGQFCSGDAGNVAVPQGDDRDRLGLGGDHGGVSFQRLNSGQACRVPHCAMQRANVTTPPWRMHCHSSAHPS